MFQRLQLLPIKQMLFGINLVQLKHYRENIRKSQSVQPRLSVMLMVNFSSHVKQKVQIYITNMAIKAWAAMHQ